MHGLSPNLRGIIFMVLSTASFVCNDTLLKLATEGLAPFQTLFLRGVSACLWLLPMVLFTGNGGKMVLGAHWIVLLRNVFEAVAVLCFIVALANLPLADVTAINQTSPMLLLLGVAVLFGDRIGWVRIGLIVVGFGGALLVARPTMSGVSPYVLLGFACAILAAARDIVGRAVPAHIPALVVAYWTCITVMVGAAAATFLFEAWQPVQTRHVLLLAGSGFFLTFGHLFIFMSYRTGATGVVAPFYYMFAVWAVISGLLVFHQLPDALALTGIGLILLSGVVVALLDERKRRLTPIAEARMSPEP
jgi:drug/metabolite transporter (DMT)-like permease